MGGEGLVGGPVVRVVDGGDGEGFGRFAMSKIKNLDKQKRKKERERQLVSERRGERAGGEYVDMRGKW